MLFFGPVGETVPSWTEIQRLQSHLCQKLHGEALVLCVAGKAWNCASLYIKRVKAWLDLVGLTQ